MKYWPSILFFFSACNCHGHADDCYYDSDVEQQQASLNIQGVYAGGGVCINCQVRHCWNQTGCVTGLHERSVSPAPEKMSTKWYTTDTHFLEHFFTFAHKKAFLARYTLGLVGKGDWETFAQLLQQSVRNLPDEGLSPSMSSASSCQFCAVLFQKITNLVGFCFS